MASVEDVQDALVLFIYGLIYPNGVSQPKTVSMDAVIYAGWPMPDKLDKDVKANKAHISVFTRPEERNTSRGLNESVTTSINGNSGTTIKAVGYQEQLFQISIWVRTPTQRTELGNLIDPELKDIKRLPLPDGSFARLIYRNHANVDDTQKAGIYQKHLFYYVEYATTKVTVGTVITTATVDVTSQNTSL